MGVPAIHPGVLSGPSVGYRHKPCLGTAMAFEQSTSHPLGSGDLPAEDRQGRLCRSSCDGLARQHPHQACLPKAA